jgi:hypothetical protein
MRRGMVAAVLMVALFSQGCGMIVHGEMQDLSVTTIPAGATARVGKAECVTPCILRVKRNADTIYFTRGSLKDEYYLDKSLNVGSTVFGNILWIAPGMIIDLIGGGGYTIKPVNVTLGTENSPQ